MSSADRPAANAARDSRDAANDPVLQGVARVQRTISTLLWTRTALLAGCAVTIALTFLVIARAASVGGFTVNGAGASVGASVATGGQTFARLTVMSAVVAAVVGAAVLLFVRWRAGGMSTLRAALWIEERTTSGYARIAMTEDAIAGGTMLSDAQRMQMERAVLQTQRPNEISAALRTMARSQLVGPALFLAVGIASLTAGVLMREVGASAASVGAPAGQSAPRPDTRATPISAWRVRVVAPTYSNITAQALGNADAVKALAGSRITVDGDGSAPAATAKVLGDSAGTASAQGSRLLKASAEGNSWQLVIAVGIDPLEVRISRGGATRLLLVEGYADTLPHVVLRAPARDSVLRTASGSLPLIADLHDDLGIASTAFEMIVSSGEGERFTARALTLGARRMGGARNGTLRHALDLDSLKLGPGDVVHLRAVARDANPAAGREAGSSETRSFRIARPSEYDSISVEPIPPPGVDSSLLSQRMLLMLTERLEKKRPTIDRATLASESRRLARDQARLRESVGDIVFQRLTGESGSEKSDDHDTGIEVVDGKLTVSSNKDASGMLEEGDDSPVININRPLLEAFNAMWDASRALEQASPREAIPYMRVALAAIERARTASRLYLRGKPPVVLVDIAKIRLVGKDTGVTNRRTARDRFPARDADRERRLLSAISLFASNGAAARDSLAVLRLDAVGDAPLFADALTAALDDIRAARDVTSSLIRARRALGGSLRLAPGAWTRAGGR